jgi:hypothetical protein
MPGNHPEESMQHSEHGKILKQGAKLFRTKQSMKVTMKISHSIF